jgi:MFS family permease
LGGSGPVVWSYFAEFQPKQKRGSMLSSMAAFWTLGNLFVASKGKILTNLIKKKKKMIEFVKLEAIFYSLFLSKV